MPASAVGLTESGRGRDWDPGVTRPASGAPDSPWQPAAGGAGWVTRAW